MRPVHRCLLALVPLGIMTSVAVLCGPAADANVVIDHDLDVATSQTLSDETYEVHGNVTVRPGATLTLARASLVIVGEGNGTHLLDVREGGRLLADNSTIRGLPHTIGVHLGDGCTLVTTTVEHVEAANASRGLWLRGGAVVLDRVTVRDCPNNTGILVGCNLTATSCVFTNLGTRWMQLVPTGWRVDVVLHGCVFEGVGQQPSGATGLHIAWSSAPAQAAAVTVDGCTFKGVPVGMLAQLNSSAVLLDCTGVELDRCPRGLAVEGNRARVTIEGCQATERVGLVGVRVHVVESLYEPLALVLGNTTVEGYERGIWVLGPSSGFGPTLSGLQVSGCDAGVSVQGCPVVVVDSRVLDCTYCFEVQQRGRIEVHRTEHEHRSGYITPGQEGAIVAYSVVNVTSCAWRDAHPLVSGTLFLYGDDGIELERLDLGALAPVEVVAWSKSRWYNLGRLYVVPAYIKDGARFEAANFSIYNTSGQRVEVVDNRTPVLSRVSPQSGVWQNASRIDVTGNLVELGTGLESFTAALDDGTPVPVEVGPDGNWSVAFGPLEDGRHNVTLRAADRALNVAGVRIENVTVDTVLPTCGLPSTVMWNTSLVTFLLWTEPKCDIVFADHLTMSGENGLASVLAYFEDGHHVEFVNLTDRAGNSNSLRYEFDVDTTPPSISVDPPDGALLDSTVVFLRVTLTGGVHELYVDGSRVLPRSEPLVGPWTSTYRAREGDNVLEFRAVDLAGNEANWTVRWVVDSLPPLLTLIEPLEGRFFTVADTVTLRGEVTDAHLAAVILNKRSLDIHDGSFASLLHISDGENVFTVEALDAVGHSTVRTITILRDTTLPTCNVTLDIPYGRLLSVGGALLATHEGLRVTFHPSEWVRISAHGGYGQANGTGPIVFELTLDEGPNEFTFAVVDEAGNVGAAHTVRVTLDTTPPKVRVQEPANLTRTQAGSVRLMGRVEPGANLTVNGADVPLAGDGSFSIKVDLALGVNKFSFVASDAVGLTGTAEWELIRDARQEQGTGHAGAVALLGAVVAVLAVVAVYLYLHRHRRGIPKG
jgi:hypothetical protein